MRPITVPALTGQLRGWLQEDYETLQAHKIRPAIIICAGGCYRWESPREQDAVALEFLSMGYQAFLMDYSCGPAAGELRPLRELAAAVSALRANAKAWHIDPEKIAVLGFSAGGHLTASLGAYWNAPALDLPADCRPDALVLCYPVISMKEFSHAESVQWVTGGDPALLEKLHLWDHITPDFPPCFLWHGGADESVPPENSLLLALALRRSHIPFEYHLFETGAHGISTCTQEVETREENCRAWVPLCKGWLNRRFQYTP